MVSVYRHALSVLCTASNCQVIIALHFAHYTGIISGITPYAQFTPTLCRGVARMRPQLPLRLFFERLSRFDATHVGVDYDPVISRVNFVWNWNNYF